jgi:hypothetical protein
MPWRLAAMKNAVNVSDKFWKNTVYPSADYSMQNTQHALIGAQSLRSVGSKLQSHRIGRDANENLLKHAIRRLS